MDNIDQTGQNQNMPNKVAASGEVKIGAWKGGWLLAKASWSTLKLDKELVLFPVISAISAVVVLAIVGIIAFFAIMLLGFDQKTAGEIPKVWEYVFGFFVYLAMYITTSFFSASIISSALYRFKGGDPTIKYGLSEARKHFGSLFKFSLLASTVGMVLQIIQEKGGIFGKIFSFIGDIAWGMMSLFVIPVIVSSDKPIGPFEALRESVNVFKKVWSKNYVGGLAMGLVFLMAFLLWMVVSAGIIVASMVISPALLFVTAPIAVISLILIISVSSALSSIFQAALYYYAQTGESPVHFEKELLHAAFKPKKGSFV